MKILLADDHALFREGMKHLLADLGGGAEITEARDGTEVLQRMSAGVNFNLVLLDLAMPGLGGLAVLATLRRQWPETPVVVLSASEDPTDIRAAMAGGASGFIPKSVRSDVMHSALELVLGGGVYLPRLERPDEPTPANRHESLTPRQREVLGLLELGKSNKEIGRALGLTEGTVKQHVSAILKALNALNRMQLALTAGKRSQN